MGEDIIVEVRLTRPTLLGGIGVGYWIATTASITFQSAIRAMVPSSLISIQSRLDQMKR